ncbi:hypothetical protein LXL04_012475 [Taraxacum kok-saghyz]
MILDVKEGVDESRDTVTTKNGRQWTLARCGTLKVPPLRAQLDGRQGFGAKPCPKCNRYHKGECTTNQRTCYKCGKPGHLSTECKTGRVCYGCGSPNHIKNAKTLERALEVEIVDNHC